MSDAIDRIRIATPCRSSWERMEGDERVRHCAECSLNVYNIEEMTREEVRALIERTEGRVCVRLHRRADGTVLTRDCPTGLRELRRRASRAAAAAVAALLSLPAFAKGIRIHRSKVSLTVEQAPTVQPAVFTGVAVIDDSPLPGVTVVLRDEATKREATVVTDSNGIFIFPSLSDGTYRVDLMLDGLKPARIDHLELKFGAVTHARVAMQLPPLETVTVGGAIDLFSESTISTTFTQSFIDNLPH